MEKKLCNSCNEPVVDRLIPCPLSCMSPKCKAYQNLNKIDFSNRPVVWMQGGPGSGRTTQCIKIANKYGYSHVSIGDLLRAEAASGSDRARCLATVIARGALVPTDIVINVIRDEMLKTISTAKGYVIDGFPRVKGQGQAFEKTLTSPTTILYLDLNPATLLKRMTSNMTNKRIDDTDEAILFRIQTFLLNNQVVLDQYTLKVQKINGEASIDEVFAEIQTIMDPIVSAAVPTTTS